MYLPVHIAGVTRRRSPSPRIYITDFIKPRFHSFQEWRVSVTRRCVCSCDIYFSDEFLITVLLRCMLFIKAVDPASHYFITLNLNLSGFVIPSCIIVLVYRFSITVFVYRFKYCCL